MIRPVLLLATLQLAGCARERPLAPTEMTDLVRYMFQNWEDEALMGEALANLTPWLASNVPSEEAEDGYRLDPLTTEDVSTVERPDRSLEGLLGAAGGAISAFPLADHAGHMLLTDQTWSNPSQYKVYVRTVEGNTDAFLTGEGILRTSNAIETSTLGVTIPYDLEKDYRWVRSEGGDEAIIARSWTEARGCNDGGGNCLEQSYSIDLYGENGSETVRFTASWSEVTSSISLPDDTLVASLAMGIQNIFVATDEFLAEGE